jgi:hypothetical protein
MTRWVAVWLAVASGAEPTAEQVAVAALRGQLPGLDEARASCVVGEIRDRAGAQSLLMLGQPEGVDLAPAEVKVAVLSAFTRCKAWTPIFVHEFEKGGVKISKKATKCLDKLFVENESMLTGMLGLDEAAAADEQSRKAEFTGLLLSCFTKNDLVNLAKVQAD